MKDKYFNIRLYFTIFFTLAVFGEVSAQFDTIVYKKAWYWPGVNQFIWGTKTMMGVTIFLSLKWSRTVQMVVKGR
ncbi:MAG: hypothetical protein IPN18_15835 [Ignavibacteriales bacterium]|nr:hypothetical protein [Ignavibacteriales bacterium]